MIVCQGPFPVGARKGRRKPAVVPPREALLDNHFRDVRLRPPPHRSLNGPYPADSWACNPRVQRNRADNALLDPHDTAQAQALDLLAEELRLSQNALNEITGEFTSDDLLGVIFTRFCIGK